MDKCGSVITGLVSSFKYCHVTMTRCPLILYLNQPSTTRSKLSTPALLIADNYSTCAVIIVDWLVCLH